MTHPCLIIGEVGQAHDGSLGLAHAYIDTIANAGADAVKFQTHIAQAESTPGEPWRVKFSRQDATRYDYWRRMEFSEEQWQGLRTHAADRRLKFISSPFSLPAAQMLQRVGLDGWKVASGEITNRPLLEFIVASGIPILLSTGMSALSEIDEVVGPRANVFGLDQPHFDAVDLLRALEDAARDVLGVSVGTVVDDGQFGHASSPVVMAGFSAGALEVGASGTMARGHRMNLAITKAVRYMPTPNTA